jgi:hypothetical protein
MKYYNLYEHIPEDEHSHISNKIWEAFDRAGIKLSQDAELSIKVYEPITEEEVSHTHTRRDLDLL